METMGRTRKPRYEENQNKMEWGEVFKLSLGGKGVKTQKNPPDGNCVEPNNGEEGKSEKWKLTLGSHLGKDQNPGESPKEKINFSKKVVEERRDTAGGSFVLSELPGKNEPVLTVCSCFLLKKIFSHG